MAAKSGNPNFLQGYHKYLVAVRGKYSIAIIKSTYYMLGSSTMAMCSLFDQNSTQKNSLGSIFYLGNTYLPRIEIERLYSSMEGDWLSHQSL